MYASDGDFAGIDGFGFEVCDDAAPVPACDSGQVTINVFPRARDDVAVTFEETAVSIPILSNDTRGAPVDPTVVTAPTGGTVTLDPGTGEATYTPAPGFSGTDTFEYRICSPSEPTFCDTAVVAVEVIPLNRPPTVDPLTLRTSTGAPVTGQLAMADPDVGDVVVAARGIPPRSGTATVEPQGATTYRPLSFFAGRDLYGVVVCDDGLPRLCATGRVSVEVVPVATPDGATTTQGTPVGIDVAANDRGIVGPPAVTGGPSHGSVTVSGGTVVYVPDAGFSGTDTFEYTICAATADDLCATTTVTVLVTAAPEPPQPQPQPEPQPPEPDADDVLAVTGAEATPVLALGSALVLVGGLLVAAVRRRRT